MNILIVDDNADDRTMLRCVLKHHGHDVVEAVNGEKGLHVLSVCSPDLILSDVLMPVMDGFEFLRNVRKSSPVPFIFYSAVYDGNRDKKLAASLGADGYLIKPKDPVELMAEIVRIVAERSASNDGSGLVEDEIEYLKRYSQVVASKLEEKVRELEETLAERKRMEDERLAHIRFLESLDRVNKAMQGANDLELMMSDVLDTVLTVFGCDRAYLLSPCDPDASSWSILMERTTPDSPGAKALGLDISGDPEFVAKLRMLLATDGPVTMGPGTPHLLVGKTAERFGIRSLMAMAVYPKVGKPWEFGIHQCSHDRVWTAEEERLLQEIGRRLADSMTGLLMHRDMRVSEERYRRVFENSPISIWEEDFSAVKDLLDELRRQGIADIEGHFAEHPEAVRRCAELVRIVDVNRAALALHGAANKEELLAGLLNTFTPESFDTFRQELISLWHGETEMKRDAVVRTLAGEPRFVTVNLSVCPGYETTLAKVLVSLADITAHKRAEEQLCEKQERLNAMTLELTLAEERERRAIAAELHDQIGQDLTLARIKLGVLAKNPESENANRLFGETRDILDSMIHDVRALTHRISPPILDSGSLEAALKWLGRQVEADYGLQVEFRDDMSNKPLSEELRAVVYHAVRELLINTAKHARATTVRVAVGRRDDSLFVEVADDGIGFDPAGINENRTIKDGFGLFNVRRRICHLGGTFDIESSPGKGTRITICMPLSVKLTNIQLGGES